MLGTYYYHGIFRKSIIAFGTLFNNLNIKRRGNGSTLESLKVPVQYGPYQKFLAMIEAEPDALRSSTQITLPRISFEIKGLNYDGSRKLVPTQFAKTRPPAGESPDGKPVQYTQYMPVPYNLDIELNVLAKNQDDGLQIIEQILPNFHPLLNVSIEVIDATKEERDIAVVLNSVNYQDDYEGDYSQRRTLIWTLNFTLKTYLFGPVTRQKDIRKVTIDYRTEMQRRQAELRYSAEVESTAVPPVPRDEIDPNDEDSYKVVESFEDIYSGDQTFFGLD